MAKEYFKQYQSKGRRYSILIKFGLINELLIKARSYNLNGNYKTSLFRKTGELDSKYREVLRFLYEGKVETEQLYYEFLKNDKCFTAPPATKRKVTDDFDYNGSNFRVSSRALNKSLKEFISIYCEFLDRIRFLLEEIYPITPAGTLNFKDYLGSSKIGIDPSKFDDIWDLNGMLKHRIDLYTTGYRIDITTDEFTKPHLSLEIYKYNSKGKMNKRKLKVDVEDFMNEHIKKLIDMFDNYVK